MLDQISLYATDRAITWHETLKSEYDEGKIIINDFYSFLLKIKYELSERKDLNIEFDCAYDINLSSQKYPYKTQPIVFKS